ncbi:membrane protein insertase YidC [Buchnera aphidicola (Melanaphis sacchari)]|uniref:Membrane protein insertase YidC n=1 Tax=Buchnera aphidicola (Melanaphis sacchari) TaxID=2173854 RepID=A0A2U8DG05_9GAMM|nr:membrane protein insertase YidC [Buchnera aphidicola]AWH90736.1 membrane protein insertase YidC [Buchnera aphidicola (Melanaphis sacchari)]
MEVQRNFFIIIFLLASFLIWKSWHVQSSPSDQIERKIYRELNSKNHDRDNTNKIVIQNDVLRLVVNMNGGDIEEASLINYKDKLNSSNILKLLETSSDFTYQVQSGLIGPDGLDNFNNHTRPLYVSKKNFFKLDKSKKELRVPMFFYKDNGVIYTKTFILKPNKYILEIEYTIHNPTDKELKVKMFGQLKQTIQLPKNRDIYSSNFALQTFRGAAYSSSNQKYEKYTFDDISSNKNLYITTKDGWIAMLQQYFAVAWIPEVNTDSNIIYTSYTNNSIATIGYKSSSINIPANSQSIIKSKIWIGPELQQEMALIAPNLDLTVDYGYLWFLSQPLFKLLSVLHNIIGNWGFSIIAITLIMRAITYPLTKAQYSSMAKMRDLQPKINELKEMFKNDKQRMSQEMMLLYKKERINPLGGCLPIFIQMPIFLSLYYMLISSVELRHAPFMFWIKDLSGQDPYYVLPVIMGLTMFFIQKTSSNNVADPLQQKIMNFMPILFTAFFLWFPSGLVLYYIVSNLVTIIQQKIILSKFKKQSKK